MQKFDDCSTYEIFGLNVRSDFPIPELQPARAQDPADVTIRTSDIPQGRNLPSGVHSMEGGALLVVEGVGRYWVANGNEIVVEPCADAAIQNVLLYVLGSAIGLLMHQRGLLPLHANAVEIEGKAVAFLGPSGAGKSTMAVWFLDRGFRVLSDDVCVVRFRPDGQPVAAPGLPRLRLWKEALMATGREPAKFKRAWAGDETWDKFEVPLQQCSVSQAAIKLVAVYLLMQADEFRITRLAGAEAARALIENTYRGEFVAAVGHPQLHWQACLDIARHAPVFRLERQWGLTSFDAQAEQVLAHVKEALDSARLVRG